jgi:hypothetical protein
MTSTRRHVRGSVKVPSRVGFEKPIRSMYIDRGCLVSSKDMQRTGRSKSHHLDIRTLSVSVQRKGRRFTEWIISRLSMQVVRETREISDGKHRLDSWRTADSDHPCWRWQMKTRMKPDELTILTASPTFESRTNRAEKDEIFLP